MSSTGSGRRPGGPPTDEIEILPAAPPPQGSEPAKAPERGLADERLFPEMEELNLMRIIKGLLARWRLVALISVAAAVAGLVPIAFLLAPNYVSRAQISRVQLSELQRQAWVPNILPRLSEESVLGLLTSDRVLKRALEYLDEPLSAFKLRRMVRVEWPRQQEVFSITIGDEDPGYAQRVCTATSQAFVDVQHERFREALADYEASLRAAQDKAREEMNARQSEILAFRRENEMTGSEDAQQSLVRQVVELEAQAAELRALAEADRAAAEALGGGADSEPEASESTPASGGGGLMRRALWRQEVRTLRAELDRLRERYTDAHPRVRAAEHQLQRLLDLDRRGQVSAAPRGERSASTPRPGSSERWTAEDLVMSARHREAQAESLERSADEVKKRLDAMADVQQALGRLQALETQSRRNVEEHGASRETIRVLGEMKSPLFEILAPANLPDHHEGGKRRVAAGLVLFLGLALGFVVALVRAVRDTAVREPEDIDSPASPVLANVVTNRRGGKQRRKELRPVVQAIRKARSGGQRVQIILLLSANEREGKSELARDLAHELLRWGEDVVRVDANLRDGKHPVGNLDAFLLGESRGIVAELDDKGIPLVSSGNRGDDAPTVLAHRNLRRAMELAADLGDQQRGGVARPVPDATSGPGGSRSIICLLDGPALLPSVDGELLAYASDAVLLLAEKGRTHIEEVLEMVERIRDVGRPVLGVVLVDRRRSRSLGRRLLGSGWKSLVAALTLLLSLGAGCAPHVSLAMESIEEANAREEAERQPDWELQGIGALDLSPFLKSPKTPYVIGEGDVLELVVIGYPEVSRGGVLVRPDGRIGVPMLGDVHVAGLRPEETGKLLTTELATYLKGPTVTVLVQSAQSSRVLVMGAVGRPGEFVLSGPARVLDLLARAGGLSYRDETGQHPVIADLSRAAVMRGDKLIPVDFTRLLLSGDLAQNIFLEAGDVLHLPPLYEQDVIVLGEVGAPGTVRYGPSLTLLGALAQAGGLGEDARSGQVRVIRGSLSMPRVYLVDVDDMLSGHRTDVPLRPGDIVFVTTTALADWNRVIEQILPTLRLLLTARYLIEGTPGPIYEIGR